MVDIVSVAVSTGVYVTSKNQFEGRTVDHRVEYKKNEKIAVHTNNSNVALTCNFASVDSNMMIGRDVSNNPFCNLIKSNHE